MGLEGEALDAAVEAADLTVALGRYASSAEKGADGGTTLADPAQDDLRREANWLKAVSRAFAECRIAPAEDRTDAER